MGRDTRRLTAMAIAALALLAACGDDGATADSEERFTSDTYGYSIAIDPAMTEPEPATGPWDGQSTIGHGISVVDELDLSNGDFFFLYGKPVDGSLEEFATERHQRAVKDHGCAEDPTITESQVDGADALRFDMMCSGVHIQWMVTVDDGEGLVAVLGADAARTDENRATFDRLTSTLRWA